MSVCELREAWLLARQQGLGGSDAAAVVGLSPFRKPIDVFTSKTLPLEFGENVKEHLQWGHLLEPVIRNEYARRAGCTVVHGLDVAPLYRDRSLEVDRETIVRSEQHSWMLATPDGINTTAQRGVEIKNIRFKGDEWGKSGTDEIPDYITIQVQWYIDVHGLKEWDVAPLFGGNCLETFRLYRNDDLIKELRSACESFWHDNVLRNVPPPVDESESYAKYLARKYSLSSGAQLDADEQTCEIANDLIAAQTDKKNAEAREQLLKNKLAERLADAVKVVGPFGSVNWIRPKEEKHTDWEAVAKALNPPSELVIQHTKPIKKSPYIRLFAAKEKK